MPLHMVCACTVLCVLQVFVHAYMLVCVCVRILGTEKEKDANTQLTSTY